MDFDEETQTGYKVYNVLPDVWRAEKWESGEVVDAMYLNNESDANDAVARWQEPPPEVV